MDMTESKQDQPQKAPPPRGQWEPSKSTLPSTLEWQCKMRAAADKHINRMQLWMFVGATGMAAIPLLAQWANDLGHLDYLLIMPALAYAAMAVFVPMVRQKTVYNYRINEEQGECESYLYFPSFAGALFNGIAILSFVAVFAAAVMMQSLIPLLGAGAVGLGYAGRLLGWKNEIHHQKSRPWKDHNFVTVDRKRKIIVVHYTHISTGFEARLPDFELFEQFLKFLHEKLPADAGYFEKRWDPVDYRNG